MNQSEIFIAEMLLEAIHNATGPEQRAQAIDEYARFKAATEGRLLPRPEEKSITEFPLPISLDFKPPADSHLAELTELVREKTREAGTAVVDLQEQEIARFLAHEGIDLETVANSHILNRGVFVRHPNGDVHFIWDSKKVLEFRHKYDSASNQFSYHCKRLYEEDTSRG